MELGFEGAFACISCVLILNTILHLRIKYGDMVVTRITTKPYKVIYFYLVFGLIEVSYIIFLINVRFSHNFNAFLKYWFDSWAPIQTIITLELCKLGAICYFISEQTFQHSTLYWFVRFQ